ncbi:transcriptional regulator with XRE-family HTH domain [Kibdelosporangium banguiense]|uniref:Transcriptional regulator with XRE-family HTH domain n=1 Tax=Kibdelosporangium banguiense TaxID=1365924 RepID=A0ABS4THL3_9PSEU|nr:XRE family transcriptional regulator [Kibdelosporangium banguiense]MBP2323789.1 transcriptional regulator with XRE-family HTH domain [Kibdelosporangium banguiense]
MATVQRWTGLETKALRQAMRLSIRDFATHLDVGVRTVARWESRGAGIELAPDSQGLLDTAFARVSEDVKQRFAAALAADESAVDAVVVQPSAALPPADVTVQLPVVMDGRPVLVPLDATDLAACGLGGFLSSATGMRSAERSIAAESDAMSPLDRRAFLKAGVGTTIWSTLNPDEQAHVVAALDEPRRHLDSSVVGYFSRQLGSYMADDGKQGPAKTLPAVLGLVTTIEQSARDVQPDVRRQLLAIGARVAEFVAWLYRDAHDPLRASFWRDRATEWAQEAVDPAMQGYVLLKKAQAAYDERDALRMLTLSEAVRTGPWQLPIRVRAEAAQQEARGHAMLGHDQVLVERNLEEAQQLLGETQATTNESSQLGAHYNATLLRMQTAICYTEAGQPRRAAELYRQWLQTEQFSLRDYGYFCSLMASALALAGEPDEAAQVGLISWPLAVETNSGRTKAELKKVLTTLQPWQARAAVRELRDAVLTQ